VVHIAFGVDKNLALSRSTIALLIAVTTLSGFALWKSIQRQNQPVACTESLADRLRTFEDALRKATDARRSPRAPTLEIGMGGPVRVIAIANDGEAYCVAVALQHVLDAVGWPTDGVSQQVDARHPDCISVYVRSSSLAPPQAGILARALRAAGFGVVGRIDEDATFGSVSLFIGHQPLQPCSTVGRQSG
jgi:hypothetical protein